MCRRHKSRLILGALIIALFIILFPETIFAHEWEYRITEQDTIDKIDLEATDAFIDYENSEIKLPLSLIHIFYPYRLYNVLRRRLLCGTSQIQYCSCLLYTSRCV